MKNKLIPLFLLLFVIFSCSGEKKIRLVEMNFEDEVPTKGFLSFTFNQDLVMDSALGEWSAEPYIEFKPEIEGKFHWQAKNILVFTPKSGFLPATNYSGKFTKEVTRHAKKRKFAKNKSFEFHTPYLIVTDSRAYWEKFDDIAQIGIKVELDFNYKVSPSQVAKLLEIKIEGKVADFSLMSEELSEKVSCRITGIQKEDKDYAIAVKLDKGLIPHEGTEKTEEEYKNDFEIPSPYRLDIIDFLTEHDGLEGVITLYTSQQVLEENIKKYIVIKPEVKYQVDVQPGFFAIISEDFDVNQTYELIIKKGLTGKLEGKLKQDYTNTVAFGKVEPTIRFTDNKEFYVSGNGSRNIQVAIINVPKVNIKITKLYENNIVQYLSNNYSYYDYGYDYDYEYEYYYGYRDPGNMGDVVYNENVETDKLPRKGSQRVLSLDFEDKLAENQGIYVVEINSEQDYWVKATKVISISDIGLIVKEGRNNITVFANSIKTAEPLANVQIKFIGSNNQVSYAVKTNSEGVAIYEYKELKAPGFATYMVTAQLSNDYNVIPLNNTRINTSRFDVGGKYLNSSGLEAFIYGDRDLYRPGETMYLSTIIRDQRWKIPGEIPIIITITTPTGKLYKTIKKVLNKYGSFEMQINLPTSAETGSYPVNIFTSNNVLIGSKIIRVEEFMPDRIKVNLTFDKKEYRPDDDINMTIEALNLFGPPAAGRNYQVEVSMYRQEFYPSKNNDYSYYIQGAYNSFENYHQENTTDENGIGKETFNIPVEYKNMGLLNLNIFTTVFDETGRPVNRLNSFKVHTQNVYYGIRCDDYYSKTGQKATFDLIAVNKNGDALSNVSAEIQLIRHEYKTVLSQSGGYFRYKSERVEKVLQKKIIKINNTNTSFSFIPDVSGEYELRVCAPGISTYVQSSLYAYGWGTTTYGSFKVNKEGQIDIELDKKEYKVGEKANVLLKTPFTGKILITIETDKVIDHFYINTDKRAASFTLDIKEEYLPNIYIGATLFRPHEVSDIPLTVAHGYASLKVDNPDYKMPVTITAVEKSRSNTQQKIKVKSKPNSALTLAVVDEGILQVAGYATPDPYAFFYEKRALEINTSNIYPYLFPEIGMVRSQTGGGESEMAKRLNPMPNNRVKLVSFWSGILETDSRGEAEYTINVPQFSGSLRIMAVGYNNGQVFGSAEKTMTVADPLVMSVALPRFLSPGDKIDVPVILTNTTGKEMTCNTTIQVKGPVTVVSEKSKSVRIEANKEKQVIFQVDVKQDIGSAKIIIEADAIGEKFINTTDISVRPASPLQKRSGSGSIAAGKSQDVPINTKEFIESSINGKLIVSKNPLIQFASNLDHLVRYPYGCVEQTVSSAFPQIYFGDLIGIMYSEERATRDAVKNVQYALDRIKLMQLYHGGLTYWPGEGYESWWGSVYAAHFTIEAKKAGFEVDESFLNLLLKYLKKKLENKESVFYYYNTNKQREIAPPEVAYSIYVLALAGEKPVSLMNYYRTHSDQLTLDGKYMLAAAYALTGNMQKSKEVMPSAFEGEKANTYFGGCFCSYVRAEAIALNMMLEIDPDNPQVGILAKHVSAALKNNRYLNTQELSFSIIAMGKIARAANQSNISASIKSNGKEIGQFNNKEITLDISKNRSEDILISATGTGKLYYYWETEGISRDGSYIEEDSYLQVRKNFYSKYGGSISVDELKQNDLVMIELSISGESDDYIENVAITDILPACFEIENPRLTDLPPDLIFPRSRSYPQYLDIRDDRINMFVTVSRYPQHYYYLVRVVSTGTFKMGPASADAMYNGEYHSYNGAGILKVTKE